MCVVVFCVCVCVCVAVDRDIVAVCGAVGSGVFFCLSCLSEFLRGTKHLVSNNRRCQRDK